MSTGSVYRRKDGYWVACLQVNGQRKTAYSKTERGARKKLAEIYQLLGRDGLLPDPGKRTINDLLDLWLETATGTVRTGTIHDYRDICQRHIRPAIGQMKLRDLQPSHLQEIYNSLRGKGYSRMPSMVHSLLHRALKFAVIWGWLPNNPADRVLVPRSKAKRKELWTTEELHIFLESAKTHRYYPLWITALASGCRISELLALHWQDVNLPRMTIEIRISGRFVAGKWIEEPPKTKAGNRIITLPEEAIRVLESLPSHEGLVFDGSRYSVAHALTIECRQLGIREITLHQLRHLHATLLLDSGLPIPAVSARLGHSNPGITMSIYAHAIGRQDGEAARVMDSILQGRE